MPGKRYDAKCPKCNHEFYTRKSIYHEIGVYDSGYVLCRSCGSNLNVTYEPLNDCMIITPWETYCMKKQEVYANA